MVWNILKKICCIVVIITPGTRCRVYDIETDAIVLYGESFDEVLRRFRRTPEYLTILQDKYNTMERTFNEITVQVMQSIESRITQRVAEMVNYSRNNSKPTTQPPEPSLFFRSKKSRRQDSDSTTPDPIVILDGYHLLHRLTSTKERNDFRQLGFNMARQMVQLIISGMGPGDSSDKSKPGVITDSKTTKGTENGNNNLEGQQKPLDATRMKTI